VRVPHPLISKGAGFDFRRRRAPARRLAGCGPKPNTFNVEFEANSASYEKRFGGKTQMLDPKTRTRKITLKADSKGLPRRDVWDMSIVAGSSKERLGYPTQKPVALLERIVRVSTQKNDVVLDGYCGCGTTLETAQRLHRRGCRTPLISKGAGFDFRRRRAPAR